MPRAAQGAALAVAVLAVGGLAWWLLGGGGPAPEPGSAPTGVPPSRPEAPGALPAGPDPSTAAPAEAAAPEPASGPCLRGRVVDRAGKPVAGATVQAREPLDPGLLDIRVLGDALFAETPPAARAASGEDGSFVLRGLRPGRWEVGATAAGFSPAREGNVVLPPGAEPPSILLVLGPGRGLLVRVLEVGGTPVAGADVVAAQGTGFAWAPVGEALARAATDASGEARLEGLGEGRLLVVVRAGPGRLAATGVEVPGDREVEIRLGGAAVLVVRVLAEGGGPVEGAEVFAIVSAYDGPGVGLARGATGPDGTARFEGLSPGRLGILGASKPGFAPALLGGPRRELQREESTLRDGETLEMEIRLLPGAVLSGTVRLRASGAPLPGARVTVLLPELVLFDMRRTAVADAEGAYRLADLPGGRALALAHGTGAATAGALPGGLPPSLFLDARRLEASPLSFEIQAGPAETRHDLLLESTGSAAGRVLGPDGAPVAGARVFVRGRQGGGTAPFEPGEEFPPSPVLTGADGAFRVEGIPAAKDLIAVAALGGRVSGVSDVFDLEPGEAVEDLRIQLAAGGKVLGRVTGPDGAPVAGAQVVVARAESARRGMETRLPGEGTRVAATGADGAFRVEAFPTGDLTITVTAKGFVRRTAEGLRAADGEETRFDLALEVERDIRGRVRDAGGAPVAGARVAARNLDRRPPSGVRAGSATTARDGTFLIGGLPAGTWSVAVTSPDHPQASIPSVDSGGPALEIQLQVPVRISGRVLDPSGNPVGGVRVDAAAPSGGGAGGGAVSAKDGSFEIRNLVAVTYRLNARPISGFSPATIEGVEGGTKGVEIRLERALSIRGRVLAPDGTAAGGRGRVQVLDAAGKQVASTRWDGVGGFEVLGLPEGTFTLQVRVEGPPALVATATARAGSEGVVLRLQPE